MRKLIFLLLLFTSNTLLAQVSLEFGSGAQLTKFKGDIWNATVNDYSPVNEVQLAFNATLSGNIPIRYITEEVVVGMNPNVAVTLFYSTIAVDVPMFATIKIGAGSSEMASSNVGAGFGVGGQFTWFSTALNTGFNTVNYSSVFIVPSVMGEASIMSGIGDIYQIRFEITPIPVSKISDQYIGDISQINIRLLRSL